MNLTNSLSLLDRAQKLIPLATQTFSKGYKYFPLGAYPIYLESGKGAYVRDVDSNEFIDFICGLGTIILGWRYPAVDKAIKRQLDKGIIFSLPHPLEVELAELLHETIPCCEQVRFLKTGSEGTSAAVKLARAFTGNYGIARFGYQGWHDTFSIDSERPKGIPICYKDFIFPFEYNNIESLEKLFFYHNQSPPFYANEIAAVIMEPVALTPPENNFLQNVKDLCHENGALLIFDETVTGFRMSTVGAQGYGVIPDLCVMGKAIANGMPLSCVMGREDIMQEFDKGTFISSTFAGECLSLAASIATIKEIIAKYVVAHIWDIGIRFMDALLKQGIKTIGYPCRFKIVLPDESPETTSLFLQETAERGLLIHSNLVLNLCYSHGEKEIDKAVEVIGEVVDIVQDALYDNKVANLLKGKIVQPAFKRI